MARLAPVAVVLALVLVLVLVLGAAAEDDPLKPGSDFASDGVIASTPRDNERMLTVTLSKNVTALLDTTVKFPVRLDKVVKRGPDGTGLFKAGRKVAVLGRPALRATARGEDDLSERIAPYHAIVLGDGFEPRGVLPAARDKFGDKIRWFMGSIEQWRQPDTLWLRTDDGKSVRAVKVGRDDGVLTTTLYESPQFLQGDLRRSLVKGQPVRFKGKIATVLYTDAKGNLVEESERRKHGAKAEVQVTPARLVLLDPGYAYGWIETPQEP